MMNFLEAAALRAKIETAEGELEALVTQKSAEVAELKAKCPHPEFAQVSVPDSATGEQDVRCDVCGEYV